MKHSIHNPLQAVFVIIFMVIFQLSNAQNKEIEVMADLKSVTVYNSAADVFCEA